MVFGDLDEALAVFIDVVHFGGDSRVYVSPAFFHLDHIFIELLG